jgi:chemotaxis protein methyltransferase CheR
VDAAKAYLIETRLAPLARRENYMSVGELVRAARGRTDERLVSALVEAMVVSESRFFRDREVLETLWRETIPQIARRRADGVVRIWSAGCGAGQEVYSLAMLQDEAPAPTGPVELFASDISERLLERARAATYSSYEVQRGLSARQLVRHFEGREGGFQLARKLRQQVRWRRVNLLDDISALGAFDVVLCRYVASGMTPAGRAKLMARLSGAIAADGVLVLGQGEAPDVGFVSAGVDGVFGPAGDLQAAA